MSFILIHIVQYHSAPDLLNFKATIMIHYNEWMHIRKYIRRAKVIFSRWKTDTWVNRIRRSSEDAKAICKEKAAGMPSIQGNGEDTYFRYKVPDLAH